MIDKFWALHRTTSLIDIYFSRYYPFTLIAFCQRCGVSKMLLLWRYRSSQTGFQLHRFSCLGTMEVWGCLIRSIMWLLKKFKATLVNCRHDNDWFVQCRNPSLIFPPLVVLISQNNCLKSAVYHSRFIFLAYWKIVHHNDTLGIPAHGCHNHYSWFAFQVGGDVPSKCFIVVLTQTRS